MLFPTTLAIVRPFHARAFLNFAGAILNFFFEAGRGCPIPWGGRRRPLSQLDLQREAWDLSPTLSHPKCNQHMILPQDHHAAMEISRLTLCSILQDRVFFQSKNYSDIYTRLAYKITCQRRYQKSQIVGDFPQPVSTRLSTPCLRIGKSTRMKSKNST